MSTDRSLIPPTRPIWRWPLALVTFACILAAMACFDHSRDWNTATRLLLTHAVSDHNSIEITRYVAIDGRLLENPPTRDLARNADGRFFCDKPPGQSLLGVPAYRIATRILGSPAVDDLRPEPSDYWTTLFSAGLVAAMTAVLLVLIFAGLGVRPFSGVAIALSYSLATFAQPYGTLFYSHATTAFLLLASIALLLRDFDAIGRNVLAGLLTGLAIAFEYPAAVFAVSVVVVHLARRFGRLRSPTILAPIAFAVGTIPPLIALGYYHYLVTGSPIAVPYTLEVNPAFAYHKEGLGIPISIPDPAAAYGLLVSPSRGLLWYAPVLLAAVPGFVQLAKRGQVPIASVIALTFLGLFLAISGFPTWHGGVATGPRLLLAAVPLLMIPAGLWFDSPTSWSWLKVAWVAVAVASLVWNTLHNAAGARCPETIQNVYAEYLLPRLANGVPGESHIGNWLTGSNGGQRPTVVLLVVIATTAWIPLFVARYIERRELHRIEFKKIGTIPAS